MKARSGHLLAEALCALALSGVLAAAAAATLSGARRAIARSDARTVAERGGREALAVTASLLRSADSVVILGDTAVELTQSIGASIACAVDSATVTLPPSHVGSGEALSVLLVEPEPGDALYAWVGDSLHDSRHWRDDVVEVVTLVAAFPPCDVPSGWLEPADSAFRLTRLALRAPIAGLAPGTPVRLGRRGRLALYVDGRGEWMLGWRRCLGGACGIIQPIAGPLRTPAGGGFRVAAASSGWEVSVRVPGSGVELAALVPRGDALP